MEQITIDNPFLEAWLSTCFIATDGEIYLPCGAFGAEQLAVLSLIHDRVPCVRHEGHVYAPTSWLSREYPRYADAVHGIVAGLQARLQADARKKQKKYTRDTYN